MAYLTSDNGDEAEKRYELETAQNIIGRHPDCHVVIDAGAVSRQHAQIVVEDGQFYVEDLKSRNGTFVNGEKIEGRSPIKHGDQLRVCDVAFTFHQDDRPTGLFRPKTGPDGSSLATVLVDDEAESSSSTIMSKLDVSSSRGRVQYAASPEAKLSALLEITQSLGKALVLDEVLPKVLNSLFKIFVQADRGFIGLKNEASVLIPRWYQARKEDAEGTIRVSRTIVNQVMESQEAILSADAASDERFQQSQSIADFRIRSMMCAPLVDSENESMGVLQIDTLDQRKRFQPEDLEVLASIAAQAGIAIDNAQLHENALRQRSLERDLELAHEVQKGFLPDARPQLEGYEFFDYYQAANQIGGDYFDYIGLPDGRTAVIVADVVGHGVAAALLMAKLSAEARTSLLSEAQPAAAVTALNDRLSNLQIDRFVTMVMGVLNPESHEVTIVNAGHMAPIYRHVDGTVEEPGEADSGLPLGIADGMEYEQMTIKLGPGESLTMYTDGINEAMNERDECYGIERIQQLVVEGQGDLQELGDKIVGDVRRHIGQGVQDDDMCLVSFRRS